MAGVGLTGKIVPLNGGNFPVFEDVAGQGGYRSVATLADRNQLTSSSPAFLKAGMMVLVRSLQCIYSLDPSLTTWTFFSSLLSLAQQTAWFVDSVAGDDANDGKTIGTALKTVEELSRRLCPGGRVLALTNAVTVTLSGAFNILSLNVDFGAFVLRVNGSFISSAPVTLATFSAANPGTQTRGQLTTLAGAFTDKLRFRVVAGPGLDCIAFCTGLNGSPTSAFASAVWNNFNGGVSSPAAGSQVVQDTLTTSIKCVNLRTQGGISGAGWVELTNLIINTASVENYSTFSKQYFAQCDLALNGFFYDHDGNGLSITNCRILGPSFAGRNFRFSNNVFQGETWFNGNANVRFTGNGNTLDGAWIYVGGADYQGRSSVQIEGPFEHQNGGAASGHAAWTVFPGSQLTASGLMWGAVASPFALKGSILTGAWVFSTSTSLWTLASTQDWNITGHVVPNSGTPIGYPRANCGVAINPDPAAVGVTT